MGREQVIDLGEEDEPIQVDPIIDPVPHRDPSLAPMEPPAERQESQTDPAGVSEPRPAVADPGAAESVL